MTEIITDMENDDYHTHQAVGASGLKLIDQSPLHYWARYLDPSRERDDPTPAMKLGTAIHAAILEQQGFNNRYVVMPEGVDKRSKDGKALFAEIEASGMTPLKPAEMDMINRVQHACHQHPVSKMLFANPARIIEASLFWTDAEIGVLCKIRPDFMLAPCAQFPTGLIMDAKSTVDASPDGFPKQVWNLKMYIQAAWYCDGFMQIHGTTEPPLFLWLAGEKETPFACAYYRATADIIAYGRKEYRRLLDIYAECLNTDTWPGYPQQINDLVLPPWAQKIVENPEEFTEVEISYA